MTPMRHCKFQSFTIVRLVRVNVPESATKTDQWAYVFDARPSQSNRCYRECRAITTSVKTLAPFCRLQLCVGSFEEELCDEEFGETFLSVRKRPGNYLRQSYSCPFERHELISTGLNFLGDFL